MGETVRFSELAKAAGSPELYLPLAEPKQDRNFMRAVREDRVLSLRQQPTGTKKDFGTVGYVSDRFVSYLVFPEPLAQFKGKRIIGIKYDTLSKASLTTPKANPKSRGRSTKPKPPSKPKPRPKCFTATVRLVSTSDVRVTVEAFNEKEARTRAKEIARRERPSLNAQVETRLLEISVEPLRPE